MNIKIKPKVNITQYKNHEARWHLLGLFILTSLVFSNTLFFGFVWDDNVFLVGQDSYPSATLKDLLLKPINGVEYLPLRDLTYLFDYYIWGWNPFGFHLSNLILYVLNIWAIYRFTFVLSATTLLPGIESVREKSLWIAFLTAALFAVHPIHSEVASFIHCRNVLLSGLFFFLSCTYFLKYLESKTAGHFASAFILFAFALLSKATVIMLPLVLLLIVYFRPNQKLKDYLSVSPFFVLALVFYFIYKFHATQSNVINEDLVIVFASFDIFSRVAVALQIPFFYMAKLAAPVGLTTEYHIEFVRKLVSPTSIAALTGLAILLVLAVRFRKKVPRYPFAFLWFLVCLIPVSNLFLTNPVVADRYVYLSSYAFVYALAVFLHQVRMRAGSRTAWLLVLIALGAYSWSAANRNTVWRTEITVMEDMTKPYSNRIKGYNNLGKLYFDKQEVSKALEYFEIAKELSPAHSQLEYYLALLALRDNDRQTALDLLEFKLRFNDFDAQSWVLHGEIQESMGNFLAAARSYQKSLDSIDADSDTMKEASSRRHYVREKLGPMLESRRKYMADNPGDLEGKAQFAIVLQEAGLRNEAAALYTSLLEAGGANWQVYYNLGLLYADDKQFERALQNFQSSLSLNDSASITHNELGVLYKKMSQFDAAVKHFQKAIELDPRAAKPLINLARLHFQLGNKPPAKDLFTQASEKFPDYKDLVNDYLKQLDRKD